MLGRFMVEINMSGLKKNKKPYSEAWFNKFEDGIKQYLRADDVEIVDCDFWDEDDEEEDIDWYE